MNKPAPIHSPEHQEAIDDLIQNAFSDHVRKERRNLLLLSAVSIFLGVAKIVPSEVSTLGLRISNAKPGLIYGFLLALSVYSFCAYWLHANPEFRAKQGDIRKSFQALNAFLDPTFKQLVYATVAVNWRYRFWVWLDYRAPIFIGGLSIAILVIRLFHLS